MRGRLRKQALIIRLWGMWRPRQPESLIRHERQDYKQRAEKKGLPDELDEIKEIKEILDPEGIPFLLLKGASSMLRLYPQPGLRIFCDIGTLIPDARYLISKKIRMAGYKLIAPITTVRLAVHAATFMSLA